MPILLGFLNLGGSASPNLLRQEASFHSYLDFNHLSAANGCYRYQLTLAEIVGCEVCEDNEDESFQHFQAVDSAQRFSLAQSRAKPLVYDHFVAQGRLYLRYHSLKLPFEIQIA